MPNVPVEAFTSPLAGLLYLLLVVGLLVLLGIFVPRWTVKALLRSKDEQIQMLKDLRLIDQARYDVIESTVKDIQVVGETMLKVVKAIPVPHNEDMTKGAPQ